MLSSEQLLPTIVGFASSVGAASSSPFPFLMEPKRDRLSSTAAGVDVDAAAVSRLRSVARAWRAAVELSLTAIELRPSAVFFNTSEPRRRRTAEAPWPI